MLLSEPQRTNYDLTFSFLNFPVRVHPAFFIMPILLGHSFLRGGNVGVNLLILTSVFFISILVHELGHTLAYRYYGRPSRIVLYWMGGLAISDGQSWNAGRQVPIGPDQQMVISFAGPLAGLLLGAVMAGVVLLLGGSLEYSLQMLIPTVIPDLNGSILDPHPMLFQGVSMFLHIGLFFNIFWSLVNLAPIYPLDGGQISRQLFTKYGGMDGIRMSIITSVAAGALIAVFALSKGNRFMAFLFGYLAFMSYQSLRQAGRFGGRGPW